MNLYEEYLENSNHFAITTTSMRDGIKINYVATSKVRVKNQSANLSLAIIELCYIHCIVCFLDFYLVHI